MAGRCVVTMVMVASLVCLLRDQTGVLCAPVEPESDGEHQNAKMFDELNTSLEMILETLTAFKDVMGDLDKRILTLDSRVLDLESKYMKEKNDVLERLVNMETSFLNIRGDMVVFKRMDQKVMTLDERQDSLEAVIDTTNKNLQAALNPTCGTCAATSISAELMTEIISRVESGIEWPTGTYGLPRTNTGCPEAAGARWYTGVRRHDTEDDDASNQWTNALHFDGGFGRNDMEQKFCMKTTSGDGYGSWPRGSYCIFKKGGCPGGFQSGEIYWDDEDDNNGNSRSGEVPDGNYDRNTLIRYCCRNDGSADNHISLPNRSPFYLFRYRQGCQKVAGMNVLEEFFRWDDEDDNNGNSRQGAHPYDSGENSDHRLHYCYYL